VSLSFAPETGTTNKLLIQCAVQQSIIWGCQLGP